MFHFSSKQNYVKKKKKKKVFLLKHQQALAWHAAYVWNK